jgi:hypothetical protein
MNHSTKSPFATRSAKLDLSLTNAFGRLTAFAALVSMAGFAVGCVASRSDEPDDQEDVGQEESALYGDKDYWPTSNGITTIPVCWTFSGYDTDKAYVRAAVTGNWEGSSSIQFTGWGTCSTSQYSSAVIRIGQGDVDPWSEVGYSSTGVDMKLNFTYSSWNSYTEVNCSCPWYDSACVFHDKDYYQYSCDYCSDNHEFCDGLIGLHEFGHALGFKHEQQRPDNANGTYCNEWESGETTYYGGDYLTSSYDTDSIMSYCSTWDRTSAHVSSGDITGVNAAYGAKTNHLTHQVLIYSDSYYSGSVQALYPGTYDVSDLTIGNDALSSIRIPSGWSVRLYKDSGKGGSYIDLTGDVGDLSNNSFDNVTSSIVVTATDTDSFPVIYPDTYYGGTGQTLRPGLYDVSDLTIGNDAASSITIPSGWTITLYANSGFSGSTMTLTSSYNNFKNFGWNDVVSSIRVEGPSSMSPVMIFKDQSYQGAAQALWPGRYNVSDLDIGNDALTSIIIPSGWTVTLLSNSNFWGTYVQLTSSSSNVGTSNSFNDEASSIVVQGPTN